MNTSEDLGLSIISIRYKIIFVGDVAVGKTSIMTRIITNEFKDKYDATIGVDFVSKTLEFRDNTLKLQIWDSAGQERYKSLIPSYVRGAAIIFIIYDISKRSSYLNLNSWINFIKETLSEDSFLVLCGNKLDLNREVEFNEGKNIADKENMKYFEVSAKNAIGIDEMFYNCIVCLPFFEQFNVDKKLLVQELESNNKNKIIQNNSFYDFRKNDNNNINTYKPVLNVNYNNNNNDNKDLYQMNIDNEENNDKCNC